MLNMFRRRRRDRDGDSARDQRAEDGMHTSGQPAAGSAERGVKQSRRRSKPSAVTSDPSSASLVNPTLNKPFQPIKSTLAGPEQSHPVHLGSISGPFVSFINFKDVVAPHSPTSPLDQQPVPALVYTAGGKAKSMYTVARPASVRKHRDSIVSHSSHLASPYSAVPPIPAIKLPSVKARHKQVPTFNLCVAGTPSSGKTSFIRLLCETLDVDKDKESTQKAFEAISNPFFGTVHSSKPASITVTANVAFEQRLKLTVYEAGSFVFGTDTAQNLQSDLRAQDLVRFVEARLDASIAQETAIVRQPLTSNDCHIHACLYFLDQTCFVRRNQVNELNEEGKHIKGFIDLELSSHHLTVIKQLQKRVNVIPIIAKADEFTIAQTESVKTLLHALCSNSTFMNPMGFAQGSPAENESYDSIGRLAMADGVDSGNEVVENTPLTPIIRSRSNSMHRVPLKRNRKRFSQVAIKPSEAEISKIFPISLISPEKFDLPPMPKGVSMQDNLIDQPSRFQRKFKYGIADVLNENHCDFIGFKKVLFGTGWKTLKELTEEKFEEFRTERLQERQARSRSNTSSAVPS